ncbi:unnamed protein product, partial [Effrenium voratum]
CRPLFDSGSYNELRRNHRTSGIAICGMREPAFGHAISAMARVVRHIIPADNSCLFNSVAYAMGDSSGELRDMVAAVVISSPDVWTEAMLGKDPEAYADWIMDSEHWGGGIELAILAEHFQTELAAFDIQSLRVDIFGQGSNFKKRALLIYDGIHYDVLVRRVGSDQQSDVTLFEPSDEAVMEEAMQVAKEANAARSFTDTGNFTLRCTSCQKGLTGQEDAVEHAKATGHTNFAEY